MSIKEASRPQKVRYTLQVKSLGKILFYFADRY